MAKSTFNLLFLSFVISQLKVKPRRPQALWKLDSHLHYHPDKQLDGSLNGTNTIVPLQLIEGTSLLGYTLANSPLIDQPVRCRDHVIKLFWLSVRIILPLRARGLVSRLDYLSAIMTSIYADNPGPLDHSVEQAFVSLHRKR